VKIPLDLKFCEEIFDNNSNLSLYFLIFFLLQKKRKISKMAKNKDYYKILEIEKDASEEDIKLAYRRLAKKFHPDLNKTDPEAKEKFIELHEAYDTLNDPQRRKIYDQAGYNLRNIDLSDLFWRNNYRRFREILRQIYSTNNRIPKIKPPPEGMYI